MNKQNLSLRVNDGMTLVPRTVMQLSWLVTLDLSENMLLALPADFFESLLLLEDLDLSFNCLVSISHSVGKCQQLKTLRLVGNRLTALPAELGKISTLEELELGTFQSVFGNPITEPPPEVWQRIGQPKPHATWGVTGETNISRKGLGYPKREGKDELIAKRKANNQGADTCEGQFGNQKEQGKDVGAAAAASATAAVADSKEDVAAFNVERMDVHSIHHPALKVVEEDHLLFDESSASHVRRLRNYLLATLLGGSEEHWALALPVLGLSEVGKTSLINAMVEGAARCMRVGDRTVGVEQRAWRLPVVVGPGGDEGKLEREIDLRIFDFAGQAAYSLFTHHMFLTHHGLCIVAFDLHKYRPHHIKRMVLYFIGVLQSRVPGAAVLIVGTHADMVNEEAQQQRCEHVLRVLTHRQGRDRQRLERRLCEIERMKRSLVEAETQRLRGEKGNDAGIAEQDTVKHWAEQQQHQHLLKEVMGNEVVSAELAALDIEYQAVERQISRLVRLPDKICAISSLTMAGITELIEEIKRTALDKSKFPRMGQTIPRVYRHVRDCLREWREETPYCKKAELIRRLEAEVGEELQAGHESDGGEAGNKSYVTQVVSDAVAFQHEVGEVVSYASDCGGGIADTVFLSMSWLVDVLKYLVRHDHSDALVYDAAAAGKLRPDEFERAKALFLSTGWLTTDLLRCCWHGLFPLGLDDATFAALLGIVKHLDVVLVVENEGGGGAGEQMLVPAFFPRRLPPLASFSCAGDFVERWIALSEVVPVGLMQSLQARLYAHPYFSPARVDESSCGGLSVADEQDATFGAGALFTMAKEGLVVRTAEYELLVRMGDCTVSSESDGIQIMGRGRRAIGTDASDSKPWAAIGEVESCVLRLLGQWKGVGCRVFARWRWRSSSMAATGAGLEQLPLLSARVEDLQRAVRRGAPCTIVSGGCSGDVAAAETVLLGLEDALGPVAAETKASAAAPPAAAVLVNLEPEAEWFAWHQHAVPQAAAAGDDSFAEGREQELRFIDDQRNGQAAESEGEEGVRTCLERLGIESDAAQAHAAALIARGVGSVGDLCGLTGEDLREAGLGAAHRRLVLKWFGL
ncbi:unnamed protein product [Prorocentrum cordatum]|uniref:Roc domain-containing protein n=1 Tax=Prorocentrum cordatum TaxID=2364126 RepID=A0ABN9TWN4_9DINO|nr:unnamed protein product [Polarella glacialis]